MLSVSDEALASKLKMIKTATKIVLIGVIGKMDMNNRANIRFILFSLAHLFYKSNNQSQSRNEEELLHRLCSKLSFWKFIFQN